MVDIGHFLDAFPPLQQVNGLVLVENVLDSLPIGPHVGLYLKNCLQKESFVHRAKSRLGGVQQANHVPRIFVQISTAQNAGIPVVVAADVGTDAPRIP